MKNRYLILIFVFIIYLWSFNAMYMDDTVSKDSIVYDYDLDVYAEGSTIHIGVEESRPHLNPSPLYWLFAVSRAMCFGTIGYVIGKMKR